MKGSELNPLKVGIRVHCAVCGYTKKPIGRSAPLDMSYCDDGCLGYRRPPFVGSLWPDESEAEFGYPVNNDGTEIVQPPPGGQRSEPT